jgi:hypothetical protein
LLKLGLKRRYKPYWEGDSEAGSIALETRRFAITDGTMKGTQMDIYDDNAVRVWTSRKAKAMALARANGFKVRLLDGEAELHIPTSRADEFLHGLGAKVKATRVLTPEQRAELSARMAKVQQARKKALATPR